jgi:hypothetical protein
VRRRDQHGSVTPLLIGFAVVVAMLVAVVVDASAAYLRRQGLNSLSDAAALAATEGLQGEQVYTSGLGEAAAIDPAAAAQHVASYLHGSGAMDRYPGLRYQVTTRDTTVLVEVSTPLELPLHLPGLPLTTRVTGAAASQIVVAD